MSLIVQRLLKYVLPKDDEDKFSNWNQHVLTSRQIRYAALNTIAHLEVYKKLT